MKSSTKRMLESGANRRLAAPERRRKLLETALIIVREEGADRLTLGHLATRVGISKPVCYDHFKTRSELLLELYRSIDVERVNAFREAMASGERSSDETVAALAAAYIKCPADITGEFHAVGAALAGSEEKAVVFHELLDNSIQMFVSVLKPHSALPDAELERWCVGLVGAGEALSAALVRERYREGATIETFASIIRCAIAAPAPQQGPSLQSDIAGNASYQAQRTL